MVNFSSFPNLSETEKPVHPIKIFEALPSLDQSVEGLWRGQGAALEKWHAVRNKRDIAVSLTTGAGKTLIGLLIAKSLINEGLQNVIYCCSTIDLVKQTAREADKLGIGYTLRASGKFSNSDFESGSGFCITTYAALFSGYSRLRSKHFPEAVIFDDAHVAEGLLRDAFTLRIAKRDHEALFNEIAGLFAEDFRAAGFRGKFEASVDPASVSTVMVPPGTFVGAAERLRGIFKRHGVSKDEYLQYPYAWLEDHLDAYAAVFSRGEFELTPPFLPSLALDLFSKAVQRRVYMSATMQSKTDFVRAFGRVPDEIIVPDNDAGRGERLILGNKDFGGGYSPSFVSKLVEARKAVIAVPSYHVAEKKWKGVAVPPERAKFSSALQAFRGGTTGAFTLVSRVDGIDLPKDTCRIMVIDGIPSGTSLLEKYQWEYLRMASVKDSRVANRLAQLFGRINRGRTDYGVFLVEGNDLNIWLQNERNLARLPPLLRLQIKFGRIVQENAKFKSHQDVYDLIDTVLGRDKGWLEYYKNNVRLVDVDADDINRVTDTEKALISGAISEARYAEAMWNGQPHLAREALESTIDTVTSNDTTLGGWHAVWLGAAYEHLGDPQTASDFYQRAHGSLGSSLTLPRKTGAAVGTTQHELNAFGQQLFGFTHGTRAEAFNIKRAKLHEKLAWLENGTVRQAEEATRILGELLGFTSTRPDNDNIGGPDNLWIDEASPRQLALELKTEKHPNSSFSKKEVDQSLGHMEWMRQRNPDHKPLCVVMVADTYVADSISSPSSDLLSAPVGELIELRDKVLQLIDDLWALPPVERLIKISQVSEEKTWDIEKVLEGFSAVQVVRAD